MVKMWIVDMLDCEGKVSRGSKYRFYFKSQRDARNARELLAPYAILYDDPVELFETFKDFEDIQDVD